MTKKKQGLSTEGRDIHHAPTEQTQFSSTQFITEAWFRTTLYSIGDAVITTDTQGFVQQMNPVAEKLTGWCEAEAQGKPIQLIFHILNEETQQEVPNPVDRVLREGTVIGLANHTLLIARDGTEYPIADSGAPIHNQQGEIAGVVLVFRDQTRERLAQAEIEKAYRYANAIVETVREPLIVLDAALRVVSANQAFYRLFQVDIRDTVGHFIYELGNRQWDIPALRQLLEEILPLNTRFDDFEVEHDFEKIGKRIMKLNARRIYDEGGKTQLILLAIEDITSRKLAERALLANEKHYRLLFEDNPLPMWIYDLESLQFLLVNEAAVQKYGYSSSEFLAMTIKDIRPEEDIAALLEDVAQTSATLNFAGEWRHRRKNGQVFPVEISSHTIDYHGRPARLVVAIDQTERKQAQQALEESEAKFRRLAENATDLIYRYEFYPRTGFTYVSPAATAITGYTPEEHYADPQLGMKFIHPDDRPKLEAYFQGHGSFYQPIELRWVRKDGRIIWTEQRNVPIYDENGNLVALEGIAREITERKRRELEAEALAMIGKAIGKTWQLQPLLEEIIHGALHAIPNAEKGSLALLSDENYLKVMAQSGYEDDAVLGFTYSIQWGYAGRAFREQTPLIIADVLADQGLRQNGASADLEEVRQLRSAVVVPLVTAHGPLGVVSLESTQANTFDETDIQVLSSLATPLALIIQNARLQEENEQRLHILESLHKVSNALRIAQTWEEAAPIVLDEALAIFETGNGAIQLYSAINGKPSVDIRRGWFDQLAPAALNDQLPIVQFVRENQKAFWVREFAVDDVIREETRLQMPPNWGGVCAPILSSEKVLGILWIAVPLPRMISHEEVILLESLGEIVGTALQRLRLHEEALRRVAQLQALQIVDKAITATLDLRLMLNVLLQQARDQLKADAIEILLFNPYTQMLEFAAGKGFRSPAYERTHLTLGDSFAGQAVLKREAIVIPDLQESDSNFANNILNEGFRAFLVVPLLAKGLIKGVMEVFHRQPFEPANDWMGMLEMLAGQAAIAIDNAQLYSELQQTNFKLLMAYDATIEGWARALELRDKETEGHTLRVTEITLRLAESFGIDPEKMAHIRHGSILHDIGKMAIPDRILFKPGPLDEEEWTVMRQHPQIAYDMLRNIEYLQTALEIPYCHHERWDGSGYPRGLKGKNIPLSARLFAVADVWDALTSDRPYRKAWTREKALEYIREQAGQQFDPEVVEVFLGIIKDEGE